VNYRPLPPAGLPFHEYLGEERYLRIDKIYVPERPNIAYISYKIPMVPGDIWSEWIIVAIAHGEHECIIPSLGF